MFLNRRIRFANDSGQAMVEMAIVVFLLFLLVFGITEFGRAMYTQNTLTNSARAGVRAAVVTQNLPCAPGIANLNPDCGSYSCPNTTNPEQCVYGAVCNSIVTAVDKNNVKVNIQVYDGTSTTLKTSGTAATGDTVKVTVTLNPYTSLIPGLIQLTDTLFGEATMRYE